MDTKEQVTNYREWLYDEGGASVSVYGSGEYYLSLAIHDGGGGGSVRFDFSDRARGAALLARFEGALAAIRRHMAEAMMLPRGVTDDPA